MLTRLALAIALVPVVALAGCKRQPSFAERYDAASAQVTQEAGAIDAQIAGSPAAVESGGVR